MIYVTQVIATYKYFKLDGYYKENKLGYKITETRGDEDVISCYLTQNEVRHVGEMQATTKVFRKPQRLTFFSKPISRRTKVTFATLRRLKAPQPFHELHEVKSRASSQ
jgi:hypothetical protein